MLKHIRGKAALVTGATGGIGSALVDRLSQSDQWSQIIALSRSASNDPKLQQLKQRDQRVIPISCDVTDENRLEQLAALFKRDKLTLGLLCNATGVLHNQTVTPEKHLKQCSKQAFLESLTINALAPLLVTRYWSPFFPRRDPALLVNLSARVGSIADNRLGGWYAYRSSKAALNMLTRNLSIELPRRHRGLVTISYHPGTVDTGLSRPFQGNVPAEKLFSKEIAADHLQRLLLSVDQDSNGRFYAWDGQEVDW